MDPRMNFVTAPQRRELEMTLNSMPGMRKLRNGEEDRDFIPNN